MTMDLQILNPVVERNKYRDATCLFEDCKKKPRRNNFCPTHAARYQRGTIDADGRVLKPQIRYSRDFECIVHACGTRGKISLGFCRKHYQQYRAGTIDADGCKRKEPARLLYGPDAICRAEGCGRRPRERGWCRSHREAYGKGWYTPEGKRLVPQLHRNQGHLCAYQKGCERPAYCKGLCQLHYRRKRDRYLGPAGKKNAGHPCAEPGCREPAHCRTLCVRHYYHLRQAEKKGQRPIISSQ